MAETVTRHGAGHARHAQGRPRSRKEQDDYREIELEMYVRRILRLAYLAPDVVLAIAEGRHPPTLVLQRLLAPIPLAWAEQRQTLCFTV